MRAFGSARGDPRRVCDKTAKRLFCKGLQAAMGFEPMNDGFAIRSLSPLGYAARCCRRRGWARPAGSALGGTDYMTRKTPATQAPGGILVTPSGNYRPRPGGSSGG